MTLKSFIYVPRSLGFTAEDTAWVNSAIPIADVIGPPLAGVVADKIGNFRVFMAAVTFLNGAASLLLLAVPRYNEVIKTIIASLICLFQSVPR